MPQDDLKLVQKPVGPGASHYKDNVDAERMTGLFFALRERIKQTTDQFLKDEGYIDADGNPMEAETIVTNALLQEAALHATVTAFVGGDPLDMVVEGLKKVLEQNIVLDVDHVFAAMERVDAAATDEEKKLEGPALASWMIRRLLEEAAPPKPSKAEAN